MGIAQFVRAIPHYIHKKTDKQNFLLNITKKFINIQENVINIRASGIMRFFSSKLCTIFWRIVRPKSQIMRELCELHNVFSEKLNAFCNEAVAICSTPSCNCFGRHGK